MIEDKAFNAFLKAKLEEDIVVPAVSCGHAKREACFEGPERSEPEGCASRRGRATLPATAGGGVEGDVWLSRQWKRQGAYLKELIVKSKTRGITNDEKELFKRGTNANKCI